ncbi:MAG: hypothetical protein MJ192_06425 [Clostridia bacterium]|nr:hypothetical protein [Clostridia bacterium]
MNTKYSTRASAGRTDRPDVDEQESARRLALLRGFIQEHRGFAACGTDFTVLLRTDKGQACFFGEDRWGQEACTGWTDLRAVYSGLDYVLGLTSNGSVRFAGRDKAGIAAGAAAMSGVRLLACGAGHAAALLWGGQVICAGGNGSGQCETNAWSDVVDICCGADFTVGLTAKGTVLIAGGGKLLRMETEGWRGIAGVFADSLGHDVYAVTGDGRLTATVSLPARIRQWSNLASVAVSGRGLWAITTVGELLSRYPLPGSDDEMSRDAVAVAAGPDHAVFIGRSGRAESLGRAIRKGRVLSRLPGGETDYGETAMPRQLQLFKDFDELTAEREREAENRLRLDRLYQTRITQAVRLGRRLACGGRLTAAIDFMECVVSTGALYACAGWSDVLALSCGRAHLLALHRNGRVSADGNHVEGCCDVSGWENVRSVLAVGGHSLALTTDGRVLFTGRNDHGQGSVEDWRDIALLRGNESCTVGLDRRGKLHIAGDGLREEDLAGPEWSELSDLCVSRRLIAGLTTSGCVVVREIGGQEAAGEADIPGLDAVRDWRGIRAIALGDSHIVGLCWGGRVMAAGLPDNGRCDVSGWSRVAAVVCTSSATLGLMEDGTVRVAGYLQNAPEDGVLWRDVIALAAGPDHAAAMTERGRVLSCGLDTDGQCTGTVTFSLFHDIRQYDGFSRYTEHSEGGIEAVDPAPDGAAASDAYDDTPTDPGIGSAGLLKADTPDAARRLRRRVGCGLSHMAYARPDGTLLVTGARDQVSVIPWSGVTAVACGAYATVAVSEGRLVSVSPEQEVNRCAEALNRTLIHPGRDGSDAFAAVVCSYGHVAVLRGDGRVFNEANRSLSEVWDTVGWHGGVDIACGLRHMAAVTADGRAVAAGDDTYGQCRVSGGDEWTGLVMIACGEAHTVALRADGRVTAVGSNACGQCRVEDLCDVVSIACLPEATVCVHRDGHVTIRGGDAALASRAAGCANIVAACGFEHRLALLTADGKTTVL